MRILTTIAIGLAMILAVACSDTGTGPIEDDSGQLIPVSPSEFDIAGVWEVVHVDGAIDPQGNPLGVDSSNGVLTFYGDGTYHFFFKAEPYYDEECVGIYTINADTLRWTGALTQYFHSSTILSTYQWHFEYRDRDDDLWRFRYMRAATGTQLPEVTTAAAHQITQNSAQLGGNLKSHGASFVVSYGVCWSEYPNPSTIDASASHHFGGGAFTATARNLQPGTVYYARAFAQSALGTAYGSEVSFKTLGEQPADSVGTVTDIDGNVYRTIKIGDQWWMAENLKVTRYPNGDAIPAVANSNTWVKSESGARCAYDYTATNVPTYGYLYNWYAVNDSRHLAPEGWHVPTDFEWSHLIQELGGAAEAGGTLKTAGTEYWEIPNTAATNSSGFSALPGGWNTPYGFFTAVGKHAFFWTSSEHSTESGVDYHLGWDHAQVCRSVDSKIYGMSIRCVKD